jgi:hypothetical protein
MGMILHFPNLKAQNERANHTGTLVDDDQAVEHVCLDVFARNDSANPLFVSAAVSTANILGQDFHDAADTNVNDTGGAYVALGGGVTIPAGTDFVQVSSTMGEPIEISFAADLASAGASTKKIYLVPGGAPGKLEFIPGSDNKAFIRSLSANSITEGYVTLNFLG